MHFVNTRRWWPPVVIGLLSLAVYSLNLERLPHNDELYHLLAAKGLLATGEPSIGEHGRYSRGYPFTWLVAQSIDLFGVSLTAARLPSVAFMALLVGLLFGFLRREAGSAAAWIGAGLFAISPFAIEIAQFARFYSLQCLSFFTGAWLAYAAVNDLAGNAGRPSSVPRFLAMAAGATILIGFAAYLQQTAVLGLVGLLLWGGAAWLLAWSAAPGRTSRARWIMLLGLALLGCLAVLASAASGLLGALWSEFRFTPLFNQGTANQFWWYHVWYIAFYPTLWSLTGIISVIALIARPRAAWFLLGVFAMGFLLNSLAGTKNLRYLAYAQPFLFGLWGIGLAHVLEHGGKSAFGWLREALGHRFSAVPAAWARPLAGALAYAAVLYVVLVNPAWLRSITLIADIAMPGEIPTTDWPGARPILQPWLDGAEVVVVSEELNPLYFYGRADLVLNASRYSEIPEDRRFPFAPDHRTDVPSIPDAASLERVIACHRTGLFLIESQFWGPQARQQRDASVEALLLSRARPLDLPGRTRLLAFVWETDDGAVDGPACASLPPLGARRGG